MLSIGMMAQDGERRTTTHSSEVKKDGYSIILKSTKVQASISEENLKEIDKRRDETEIVYYKVNEFVTIKILPKSMLNKED